MLSEVQRLLVMATHARDPRATLAAALADPGNILDADDRAWLASMDQDGLAITGLIVKKLRFERVVLGDAELGVRFDADPEAFTRDFERYCAEVAPTAIFPGAEAEAFCDWLGASHDPARVLQRPESPAS